MAKTHTDKSLKDAIIDAALGLAAEEPWNDVEFDRIILAAQVDAHEALEYFDDKTDILIAYGRRVDAQLFSAVPDILSEDMSEREKIFDVLMERFDLMNEHRAAILSILNSFKGDPKQTVLAFPHVAKTMTRVLEAAGLETHGLKGAAQVTGLVGVYLYVVRTWQKDESPDMAKTMAVLDKALNYAESSANSLLNGNFLSGACYLFSNFKKDEDNQDDI